MIKIRKRVDGIFLHRYQSSDRDRRSFNGVPVCIKVYSFAQNVRFDGKQSLCRDTVLYERRCEESHKVDVSSKLC